MTRALAATAVLAFAASASCAAAPGAERARAPAAVAIPIAACAEAAGADKDGDGLADACEIELAAAFAPVLLQDPGDCAWSARAGRIAGGYLHAAQPVGDGRVRIAYLPAYVTDCGWDGAKCLLPGVDCRPHAGDSEIIALEVFARTDGWLPSGVFLSAHCFEGESSDCRWYRDPALSTLEWAGSHPIVHVAAGRHANYPTAAACDRGHHHLDTCDFEPARIAFPVAPARDIGGARGGACVAAPAEGTPPADPAAVECPWSDRPFTGWQPQADGVTGYGRYLDEIFDMDPAR